jgi:hypothetical protein
VTKSVSSYQEKRAFHEQPMANGGHVSLRLGVVNALALDETGAMADHC